MNQKKRCMRKGFRLKNLMMLAVCFVFLWSSMPAVKVQAAGTDDTGEWQYSFNQGRSSVNITKYIGLGSEVVVPAKITINGEIFPVRALSMGVFAKNKTVTDVEVSEGIKEFTGGTTPSGSPSSSAGAFSNCSSLLSVSLPASLVYIGDYSFYNCTSLKSIQLPYSVTFIGIGAFQGCSAIKTIQIPDNVTTISASTFQDCVNLEYLEIRLQKFC